MKIRFEARKTPAHPPLLERYNRSTIVFLTVCAKDRRAILASAEAHALVRSAWAMADYWQVGRYMILPDHIHLFCAPARWPPHPLAGWIGYWRYLVSKSWPARGNTPVLQKDYWDTQVRSAKSYAEKWEYVRNNPVRQGLVVSADDWPYQGEMHALRWHD